MSAVSSPRARRVARAKQAEGCSLRAPGKLGCSSPGAGWLCRSALAAPVKMEWFLIIVVIVVTVMVMLGSLYVLVYFQAEEDKNTAIAPKIAVVLGLSLSCLLVLTLPLDVANRSTASGMDMETLWQVEYMLVAIMAVGVVPFLIFFYEAEDPESRNYQWWTACKYEALTVGVCVAFVLLGWLLWGYAEVPVVDYTYNGMLLDAAKEAICPAEECPDVSIGRIHQVLKVSVTPVTWIMALIAFVGWFLFVLFGGKPEPEPKPGPSPNPSPDPNSSPNPSLNPSPSPNLALTLTLTLALTLALALALALTLTLTLTLTGIGMAALPMDLLVDFNQRPVGIDLQEYAKQKMGLTPAPCSSPSPATPPPLPLTPATPPLGTPSRRWPSTSAHCSCSISPRSSGPRGTARPAVRGACSTTSSCRRSTP